MACLIKLPDVIINIDQVRRIQFEPEPPIVVVTWMYGDCSTVSGGNALALIEAIDQMIDIDVSTPSSDSDEDEEDENVEVDASAA